MRPKRVPAAAPWVFFLAWVSFGMPASAKEALQCPQTLRVSGAVLQSPDLPEGAGMAFEGGQPLPFFSMGVFSGHPRELASLVPDSDSEEPASGIVRSVWRFERPDPYGTYVVCGYGAAGKVQIYKRISDAASACTATVRKDRVGHVVVEAAVECE
ncbi:hypothetical protein OCJ37_12035 [Xanthomonas sp. AM6]|uniref:STY0301 family protein n=1 Tax=Xanthomonas sp. AM6 TaxID=2982531 RepID=UPI0021D9ED3F|nr:STY0301 family protein [Xanthomonas sp. AM6]UYB50739.1 hypothetical protein OCJ37_12035 [Xanthomonas sp. AM6]